MAAMPPLDERLRLAERTMVALVADAELPPKIAVHPRPEGSFGHAMPAHLRGADPERRGRPRRHEVDRRLPGNRALGLPALHGLVLLVDAMTGAPAAILDAGPITAERTAAISGVAISRFAPAVAGRAAACRPDRCRRPGPEPSRRARARPSGRPPVGLRPPSGPRGGRSPTQLAERRGSTRRTSSRIARAAIADADVVVTAASFGPVRQVDDVATGSPPTRWSCPSTTPRTAAAEVARDGGAVPRRPARAVPRQPRGRALRGLPGPDGDDRRGHPRGHGAAGADGSS